MSLDMTAFDSGFDLAVDHFWQTRDLAAQRQRDRGGSDQGERAGVTAGHNMDGFIHMFAELARANGLRDAQIHTKKTLVTLPGYFRPTKTWDLVILKGDRLVAAIELKSQVGPSFGNNFNNRAEEAIGTATDFWTAHREGAFGDPRPPFLGWLILVEDCPASRRPSQRVVSPHFQALPEFHNASYLDRYDLLCRKLMRERLYTSAAVVASTRTAEGEGDQRSLSEGTSTHTFATAFAAASLLSDSGLPSHDLGPSSHRYHGLVSSVPGGSLE